MADQENKGVEATDTPTSETGAIPKAVTLKENEKE